MPDDLHMVRRIRIDDAVAANTKGDCGDVLTFERPAIGAVLVPRGDTMPFVLLLTSVAMIAFAANSLLARLALEDGGIGVSGYTAVRLISGALVLMLLLRARTSESPRRALPGDWFSAFALFAYAIFFSFAYLRIGAAAGALILFTAVQGTMVGWGLFTGQRPAALEGVGLAVAFGAFLYLLAPGIGAPDLVGSALMVTSGVAWGVYSLRGRGSSDPLGATAGNFLRSAPLCVPLIPFALAFEPASLRGLGLAVASGALTSGLGYAVWYRALPLLSTTQAAVVQLTVPVIAAFGAVLFLAEAPSPRLASAGLIILGGVALAIFAQRTRRPAAT